MSELYIGDGVYAKFDGYGIWLTTVREDGSHQIYLEPEVLAALVAFAESAYNGQKPPAQ